MKCLGSFAIFFALLVGVAGARSAIVVGPAWSRPAIQTGVVYVTIANHSASPDRLVDASSPVARAVEMHESMAMGGVSTMHRVAAVTVPAHGAVQFVPGAYHIMLVGLRHDLHAGEHFGLRLHFARAGWETVSVHVRVM